MSGLEIFQVTLVMFLIYKILDKLVHMIYIGHYSERYIFVTGCDTGFGNMLVKRLDSLGCHVFAGCLTETGEAELVESCSARVFPVSLNIAERNSVNAAYKLIKESLPDDKGLWAVVNNAGAPSIIGPPEWTSVKDYKQVDKVNLYGTIDVTMTFLPLVKKERGRIVVMSSSAGRVSIPLVLPYCVSKYGLEAFSDGIRRAMYPFGVKVSIIEPGWHLTRLTERKNLLTRVVNTWTNAPQVAREEYGEAYYEYCRFQMLDNFEKIGSKKPENVVDAYVHSILGRFPRYRYLVGWDISWIYRPLQILPEWLSDFALHYANRSMPKPAAIVNHTY